MILRSDSLKWVVIVSTIFYGVLSLNSVCSICELGFIINNKLYNFSLASPAPKFPHGVLSEDGFYRLSVNETVLWFQLCDGMIFNHEPPTCVDCRDCGGPSHCGMGCSALVANRIGGYDVCTTIGHASKMEVSIFDRKDPGAGVIVMMSSVGTKINCSLSVSVICDPNGVEGPDLLTKSGTCDYVSALNLDQPVVSMPRSSIFAIDNHTKKEKLLFGRVLGFVSSVNPERPKLATLTFYALLTVAETLLKSAVLRHPSGCAQVVNVHGKGWGWFGTLATIVICLFVAYFLAGTVYRHFLLGVRGIDVIPNLDFWSRLPRRTQNYLAYVVQKFRGPSQGHRASYSPVNF